MDLLLGLLDCLLLLLLVLLGILEVGFRTRVFIERGVWGGESGLKRKLVVRVSLGFSLSDPTPGLLSNPNKTKLLTGESNVETHNFFIPMHQCVDKDRTCALCKF